MTGKRAFGRVKRELIAVRETRRLRESVGVGATGGNKVFVGTVVHVGG